MYALLVYWNVFPRNEDRICNTTLEFSFASQLLLHIYFYVSKNMYDLAYTRIYTPSPVQIKITSYVHFLLLFEG